MTRSESLAAIRRLNEILRETRESEKEWRLRAISAEGILAYGVTKALKAAVKEHDNKFGTNLEFRI